MSGADAVDLRDLLSGRAIDLLRQGAAVSTGLRVLERLPRDVEVGRQGGGRQRFEGVGQDAAQSEGAR